MLNKFTNAFFVLMVTFSLMQFHCAGDKAQDDTDTKNASTNDKVDKKKEGDEEKKEKKELETIPVEITTAVTGNISAFLLLSSNLETEKMTDVYARVQGLVENISAEEGDFVKKNQVLMKLEADEYALAEARAKVAYEQEQNYYDRKQAMFNKKLLSKEEFETSKFGVKEKKIAWQQAKLILDYTQITSPISGVIGERLKRPGDRIQPADKLFTVINTSEMIAVVHVPEKEIGTLKKGQQAYITSQHLKDRQFSGWIKRVSPVVDPQSGTFKVTIGIQNEKNQLRPGMFVNAHIITDTHQNAVLVPKTAVIYENENLHVYVIRDSVANKVRLDVGYQDFEKIESLSGINEGDKIIVVGQAGLKDKTKVNVVAEQENTLTVNKSNY